MELADDQPGQNESSQMVLAHQFLNWFTHQTDRQTLGPAQGRRQECAAGLWAGSGPAVLAQADTRLMGLWLHEEEGDDTDTEKQHPQGKVFLGTFSDIIVSLPNSDRWGLNFLLHAQRASAGTGKAPHAHYMPASSAEHKKGLKN